MGDYTARFSELHYPLLIEYADSLGPAVTASAWINMQNYHRGVLVLNVGTIVATGVVYAYLQQAQNVGGLGGKAIAGKAITPLVATTDDDSLVCIELQTEELDVSNGFNWVRFVVHTNTAAAEYSSVFYGIEPRFQPTPVANWTEVVG